MTEGPLLQAINALYHGADNDARKRAEEWLEEWRLKTEAWETATRVLHSPVRNVEALFFCAQTLVYKIQQDFEELPQSELTQLRESLVAFLLKYSREDGMQVVQMQLALAFAAFSAHVPVTFWAPVNCVHWCAERFCRENDLASVSSLTEILAVLPEEARNHRIGLHPQRRSMYVLELQSSFPTVLQILEKCRTVAPASCVLQVVSNWLAIAEIASLEGQWNALGSFVQLAVASLEDPDAFPAAVDFISELLHFAGTSLDHPQLHGLTEGVASALAQYLPQLTQESLDDERRAGLARLFCDLGSSHQDFVLSQDSTASALIEAILAVTAYPDETIHQYALEFWEQLTYRMVNLLKAEVISAERVAQYVSIYERLMTSLIELSKLPEDYPEMSEKEREEFNRRDLSMAILDAVDVVGPQRSLESLISALSVACQMGVENWQQIESLLFALTAIAYHCRSWKAEMSGSLFQALGAVPDGVVVQSALCRCLAAYGSWLPQLAEQAGADPVAILTPVITKNMTQPEWAGPAVDAFAALCRFCRSHLMSHTAELLDLQRQVLKAADASHQWLPAGASQFTMKESEAIEVIGALIHPITRLDCSDMVAPFVQTISDGILSDLSSAVESAQTPSHQLETRLVILVYRLETVFRHCALEAFSAQLLSRVCSDLLQLGGSASSGEKLVEGICTCLRYAVKSAKESGSESLPALCSALPQLFAAKQHCGCLYVASELAKLFGKHPVHAAIVQQLVMDQFFAVCGTLQSPQSFKERPDLADDAFLLAGRVLNYCPDALLSHDGLLTQIIDTALQGILVQHLDACQSVLRFLRDLLERRFTHDIVQRAFVSRGRLLMQLLLAGVAGMLPLRILDEVGRVLRSLLRRTEGQGIHWLTQTFNQLPDEVLTPEEKTRFVQALRVSETQKSDREIVRVVDEVADVCRRNRVVRQTAQSSLTPDDYI